MIVDWNTPVLSSVQPVVKAAQLVRVNHEKITEVANWMAYEEFAKPDGSMLFDFGNDPDVLMDFTLVVNTMNFAFTDFSTGIKFETDYMGKRWCDSEAMLACLHRAINSDIPFFSGEYLAKVTRKDLESVFAGTIEMPMLDERVALFNEVGRVLVEKYQGRYSNFVRSCAPRLYANGDGLLERLTAEFPRFRDVSSYRGQNVHIYKLAQLGIWGMHLALSPRGAWKLEDAHKLTAFADYIVPVGLRVMGIFEYAPELEKQINGLVEVKRDSDAEIELRASSIYVIAKLTEEINNRRPGMEPLLQPQVDFRFWKTYHATHWPHHLTKTVMY
ncbi:MAG: queuosine salvage family protein [Candidatus Planktophila sp.]